MRQDNRDRRQTYQVATELCKRNNLDPAKANPAYGYLRTEAVMKDGTTTYQFPLLENNVYQGIPQNPTEKRLALQDNFVVGSMFFGMYWWDTSANRTRSILLSGYTPYNAPAGGQLTAAQTSQIYTAATAGVFNQNMNSWWIDGTMKFEMDYDVIIPRWDCLQHYYIPRTQSYFNGSSLDPAVQTSFPWTLAQAEGLSDGWVPMEPNIVLSGGKNTQITYNLPYSLSFANMGWDAAGIASGTLQPRLVCIFRGILLQNTTSVK